MLIRITGRIWEQDMLTYFFRSEATIIGDCNDVLMKQSTVFYVFQWKMKKAKVSDKLFAEAALLWYDFIK